MYYLRIKEACPIVCTRRALTEINISQIGSIGKGNNYLRHIDLAALLIQKSRSAAKLSFQLLLTYMFYQKAEPTVHACKYLPIYMYTYLLHIYVYISTYMP